MRLINATEGLDATGRKIQVSLGIEDGRIARMADATGAAEDIIVMPALVNAHDHARPLRTFGIKPVKGIGATLLPIARFMMLDDHGRNVIQLQRIGQSHQRTMRGGDGGGDFVEHPIADIFDACFGQIIGGFQRLRQAGPSQPTGRLWVKASITSMVLWIIAD